MTAPIGLLRLSSGVFNSNSGFIKAVGYLSRSRCGHYCISTTSIYSPIQQQRNFSDEKGKKEDSTAIDIDRSKFTNEVKVMMPDVGGEDGKECEYVNTYEYDDSIFFT